MGLPEGDGRGVWASGTREAIAAAGASDGRDVGAAIETDMHPASAPTASTERSGLGQRLGRVSLDITKPTEYIATSSRRSPGGGGTVMSVASMGSRRSQTGSRRWEAASLAGQGGRGQQLERRVRADADGHLVLKVPAALDTDGLARDRWRLVRPVDRDEPLPCAQVRRLGPRDAATRPRGYARRASSMQAMACPSRRQPVDRRCHT